MLMDVQDGEQEQQFPQLCVLQLPQPQLVVQLFPPLKSIVLGQVFLVLVHTNYKGVLPLFRIHQLLRDQIQGLLVVHHMVIRSELVMLEDAQDGKRVAHQLLLVHHHQIQAAFHL